jgi:hypothetical protein
MPTKGKDKTTITLNVTKAERQTLARYAKKKKRPLSRQIIIDAIERAEDYR